MLRTETFIIQPSNDFIVNQINHDELYKMFQSSKQWIFKNANLNDVHSIFLKAGLNQEICNKLLANTTTSHDGKSLVTTPPYAVLWRFTPEIRAKLYPLIGKHSDNEMYSQPICFNSNNSDEWLYKSSLSKKLLEKLSSLVYVEKEICYISDIHLILPLINTNDEQNDLLQTLYRTKALDVYLKIKEGQDVSKIADYWGNLGRNKLIKPMLERISENPREGKINIAELLPTIPQNRLNTYSGIEEFEMDYKDCHWTTINFFNNAPDERYYMLPELFSFIKSISKPLKNAQLKFGDIICIYDENNELTHSCTFIADNLVLTKNGMGNLKPFVLTYRDKTVPLYGNKTAYYSRTISNTHTVESLKRVK